MCVEIHISRHICVYRSNSRVVQYIRIVEDSSFIRFSSEMKSLFELFNPKMLIIAFWKIILKTVNIIKIIVIMVRFVFLRWINRLEKNCKRIAHADMWYSWPRHWSYPTMHALDLSPNVRPRFWVGHNRIPARAHCTPKQIAVSTPSEIEPTTTGAVGIVEERLL